MTRLTYLPDRRPKESQPIVKVVVPFYRYVPPVMRHWLDMLMQEGIPGYYVYIIQQQSTLIHTTRNQFVEDPKELPWDFLFFLDDDIGWSESKMSEKRPVSLPTGESGLVHYPIWAMKTILDHGKDVCGGYYCQRGGDHMPLVFKRVEPGNEEGPFHFIADAPSRKGVQEVDALATGFMCVKRAVTDAMKGQFRDRAEYARRFRLWSEKNPDALAALPEEIRNYLAHSVPAVFPPFWFASFYDKYEDRWDFLGEDIFFCREAKRLGFSIWCDFDVTVGHLTEKYLTPDMYAGTFMQPKLEAHVEWCREHKVDSPIVTEKDDWLAKLAPMAAVDTQPEPEPAVVEVSSGDH